MHSHENPYSLSASSRPRVALSLRVALCASLCLHLLQGCVTKGTHADLEAKYKETQSELALSRKDNSDLRRELNDARGKATGLGTDLAASRNRGEALAGDVEKMRAALAELERRKTEADARVAAFRDLLSRFRPLIEAGKLRVKMSEGRMVVELATDVLFPSGSARLSKEGKSAIAEVSVLLAAIPDRKYQVEGHTDNVPISTTRYASNWELAADRAITVVREMIAQGVLAPRLSAASFGDSQPVRPNDTAENKKTNRRIEIVVVPDLSALPGTDELSKVEGGAR